MLTTSLINVKCVILFALTLTLFCIAAFEETIFHGKPSASAKAGLIKRKATSLDKCAKICLDEKKIKCHFFKFIESSKTCFLSEHNHEHIDDLISKYNESGNADDSAGTIEIETKTDGSSSNSEDANAKVAEIKVQKIQKIESKDDKEIEKLKEDLDKLKKTAEKLENVEEKVSDLKEYSKTKKNDIHNLKVKNTREEKAIISLQARINLLTKKSEQLKDIITKVQNEQKSFIEMTKSMNASDLSISNDVKKLKTLLNDVKNNAGQISSFNRTLEQDLKVVSTQTQNIDKRIDKLVKEIKEGKYNNGMSKKVQADQVRITKLLAKVSSRDGRLKSKLNKLRNNVMKMAKSLVKKNNQNKAIVTDVDKLNQTLQDLKKDVAETSDPMSKKNSKWRKDIDDAKNAVSSLTKDNAQLNEKFQTNKKSLVDMIKELTNVQMGIQDIKAQFGKEKSNYGEIKQAVDGLVKSKEKLPTIMQMTKMSTSILESLSALVNKKKDVEEKIDGFRTSLKGLEEKISNSEKVHEDYKKQMQEKQKEDKDLMDTIKQNEEKLLTVAKHIVPKKHITVIDNRVQNVEGSIAKTQNNIKSLKKELKHVQESATQEIDKHLGSKLPHIFGTISKIEKSMRTKIKTVHEEVSKLREKLRTIEHGNTNLTKEMVKQKKNTAVVTQKTKDKTEKNELEKKLDYQSGSENESISDVTKPEKEHLSKKRDRRSDIGIGNIESGRNHQQSPQSFQSNYLPNGNNPSGNRGNMLLNSNTTVEDERPNGAGGRRCPEGYDLHGLNCYKLIKMNLSYADAKRRCENYNGKIAIINSPTQQTEVEKFASGDKLPKMQPYACYYCSEKFDSFKVTILHLESHHDTSTIRLRRLILCEDGHFRYQSKHLEGYIPSVIKQGGKRIEINEETESITTVPNLFSTPNNDSKRHKATVSTPKHCVTSLFTDQAEDICHVTSTSTQTNASVTIDISHLSDTDQQIYTEIIILLPRVVDELKKSGLDKSYLKFFRLVKNGKFNMRQIVHLLFLDVVEFLSVDQAASIRYNFPETVKFWRVGMKLFHGRFLRFMGGPKFAGQLVGGSDRSNLNPCEANINFAVPHKTVLLEKDSNDLKNLSPGLIKPMIDAVASSQKFANGLKITVDGKKIKKGFGKKRGEIDMAGYENPPTLDDRKKRIDNEMGVLTDIRSDMDYAEVLFATNVDNLTEISKAKLVNNLKNVVANITGRLQELRKNVLQTEMAIKKVKGMAGPDWRKSKFLHLISSLQTRKYEMNNCIQDGLNSVNELSFVGATANGKQNLYCRESHVDLAGQGNYYELTEPEFVENLDSLGSPFIKQRSKEWHELRKSFRVTGSTANKALGLDRLKTQQAHFDKVVHGKVEEELSEETKARMLFGTENETMAMATLVGKVLPFLYPSLQFIEEGCHILNHQGKPFMLVSPDGSLRERPFETATLAWENKCKTENEFSTPVYYKLPRYYVMQVLAEMDVLDVPFLLFTCWSKQSMVVMEVQFCPEMWQKAWEELSIIYDPECPRRPLRVSATTKELNEEIPSFCEKYVRVLGEFPSIVSTTNQEPGTYCGPYRRGDSSRREPKDIPLDTVRNELQKCTRFFETAHNLTRSVASEVLVFMAGDLDRVSGTESSHSQPIAYYLKGSSLKKDTFRKMLNDIWYELVERNLYVPVVCSDGYFFDAFTRDSEGNPLNVLELMKDIWRKVQKESKPNLLAALRETNVIPDNMKETLVHRKFLDIFEISSVPILSRDGSLITSNVFDVATPVPWSELPALSSRALSSLRKKCTTEKEVIKEDLQSNEMSGQVDIVESVYDDLSQPLDPESEASVREGLQHPSQHTSNPQQDSLDVPLSIIFDNEIPVSEPSSIRDERDSEIHEEESDLSVGNIEDRFRFNLEDYMAMIKYLESDEKSKLHKNWRGISTEVFLEMFGSIRDLNKNFQKNDLKVCLKAVSGKLSARNIEYKFSWTKFQMANFFHSLSGGTELPHQRPKRKHLNPFTLKRTCMKVIEKFSKDTLCIITAEHRWEKQFNDWKNDNIFNKTDKIDGFSEKVDWFSRPEEMIVGSRKVPRFYILDAHHILTNLRTKICKDGLPSINISRKAWEVAAIDPHTKLNLAMVNDLIDKQDNGFARRTFAEDVEMVMELNGYVREAEFCRLLREWYESQDEPGIEACKRIEAMLRINGYLRQFLDIGCFPPPTTHVKGIPTTTFEAIVVSNERKIQLYACLPNNSYNIRAVGSLDVETFFQSFQEMDPGRSGCLDPDTIPMAMETACYLEMERLDPKTPFTIATHGSSVYPVQVLLDSETFEDGMTLPSASEPTSFPILLPDTLTYRNHFFDEPRRKKRNPKRKKGLVSDYNKPSGGERPVRQFHKADESKLLAHIRKGLSELPLE